jgi:hypothetical protein
MCRCQGKAYQKPPFQSLESKFTQAGNADTGHDDRRDSESDGKKINRRDFAKAYFVEDKASAPEQGRQNKKKMDF